MNNRKRLARAYGETLRQICLRNVIVRPAARFICRINPANLVGLVWRQLPTARIVAFFKESLGPALSHFIAVVVSVGSNKEVRWIHAKRNVAFMADEEMFVDRAAVNDPGQSVRSDGVFAIPKLTVSLGRHRSAPQPTGFCFFNSGQEPLHEFVSHVGSIQNKEARRKFVLKMLAVSA